MCVIGISCETKEATSLFKIWKKRSNRRVQVLMTPKPVTLDISDTYDMVHIITIPTGLGKYQMVFSVPHLSRLSTIPLGRGEFISRKSTFL